MRGLEIVATFARTIISWISRRVTYIRNLFQKPTALSTIPPTTIPAPGGKATAVLFTGEDGLAELTPAQIAEAKVYTTDMSEVNWDRVVTTSKEKFYDQIRWRNARITGQTYINGKLIVDIKWDD